MTNEQKLRVIELRKEGYGYGTIANAVHLKKATVVSFCRRKNLSGVKAESNNRIDVISVMCLNCGNPLIQEPGHKQKKFCSVSCRTSWWNAHLEHVQKKAFYYFTCAGCGKSFTAYGNAGRKYCCHECYVAHRFGKGCANNG